MKPTLCHLLFYAAIISSAATMGCDADVLRLNYRRSNTTKPAARAHATGIKASRPLAMDPHTGIIASIRLEP